MAERDRKVEWVAPAQAAELGPALDRFLAAHEAEIGALRAQWFGADQPRTPTMNLVDLVARRLQLMDAVGAWKRAHQQPIEDTAQEARVLERVQARAKELGLEPASVRALFEVEIALAKRIEAEPHLGTPTLDLDTELRPAIARLSDRQLALLGEVAPVTSDSFSVAALAPLQAVLTPDELAKLTAALSGVSRAK